MPIFKFVTPASAGQILVGVGVDGESTWGATGDITLSGRVLVYGAQDAPSGNGDITARVTVDGQSVAAVGAGDIMVGVSVGGYSEGADTYVGAGDILLYPFERIVVDGEAVLNGVGGGDILLRQNRVTVEGKQKASGNISLGVNISGFGACRVGNGTVLVRVPVASGEATEHDDEQMLGFGTVRVKVAVAGRGGHVAEIERSGSGSVMVSAIVAWGQGYAAATQGDDEVLRYEHGRRKI